jgi:lipopolysaccharide/colanic/teichoic acid biosynthesis glycosyltransferase
VGSRTRTGRGLSRRQRATKRAFDVVVAGVALVVFSPVIAVCWVVARIDTRASGVFRQRRIGLDGQPFEVMKLRTMRQVRGLTSTVTTADDSRITRSGAMMRSFKFDELPQLVNVLRGEMSLVGPRPDVPGFADALVGEDRILLTVRPGITSPAAVAYRHEEQLLAQASDPEAYNRDIIWPDKVRINRAYVENYSFLSDLRCLADTVSTVVQREPSPEQEPKP